MRTHIGLWVLAMALAATALGGGARAEEAFGDAQVDAGVGYSVDLGAACRHSPATATAHLGPARTDAAAPAATTCDSSRILHYALAHNLPLAPRGVPAAKTGGQHDVVLSAEPGQDVSSLHRAVSLSDGEDTTASHVRVEEDVLASSGEASASPAGASGRVEVLGHTAAGLSLRLASAPQAPAAEAPSESRRWGLDAAAAPDADAWSDAAPEPWTARAARGVEAALRPFIPASVPLAPVPQGAAGGVDTPFDGDLTSAQYVGLAAAALLPAFLAAMYQRFTASATMQHERRAAIHKALASYPQGATAGEVARALDMKRKTVEYHLHYCVKAGIVRVGVGPDGARRYSLGALPPRLGVSERLLSIIRERPGLSTAELAGALGVPRDGVDRRVKEFAIQGVVECRLVDGERRMYPGAA